MGASSRTRSVYPGAIDSHLLFALLLSYLKNKFSVSESQVAFATSICSDDLNSVELPRTNMIGPFFLGGLDGFPFVGKTGITAFAHHVPDKGVAFLFFGPHVGVGDDGDIGTILRPGQAKRTACCGAASAALAKVIGGIPHGCDPALDAQQVAIYDILNAKKAELTSAPSTDQFVLATDIVFKASRRRMQELLAGIDFDERPVIIAGGVLINEDDARGSKVSLRYLATLNFSAAAFRDGQKSESAGDLFAEFEEFSNSELGKVSESLHFRRE